MIKDIEVGVFPPVWKNVEFPSGFDFILPDLMDQWAMCRRKWSVCRLGRHLQVSQRLQSEQFLHRRRLSVRLHQL